jgi:hypothetical protein
MWFYFRVYFRTKVHICQRESVGVFKPEEIKIPTGGINPSPTNARFVGKYACKIFQAVNSKCSCCPCK